MIDGVGLGLRFKYLDDLLVNDSHINWVELLADNHHDLSNPITTKVDQVVERYPCVMHSVNLSLAGSEPLNEEYLSSLKRIAKHFKPAWFSDHLCFTQVNGAYFHDLLPFPFTDEAIEHIAAKIDRIQTELDLPFLIENISSYIRLNGSQMSEAEFIRELVSSTGCKILLDVNNIVVTCDNHNESIANFCQQIPFDSVMQIHMAGHVAKDSLLVDTHSMPISDKVLTLYQWIIKNHGSIPTCLEWDIDLPDFAQILAEVKRINDVLTAKG